MHDAIQKISQLFIQLKSRLTLEQIYNGVVVSIIVIILLLSSIALYRPVGSVQFQNIEYLSQQSMYPETQEMAVRLMQQPQVRYGQYLKLMQAHQMELGQAKQLPPLDVEAY
ncbi:MULTISPECIES: hypothetical protein [Acinetobacter]|uniref:Uncharacterized protein n=2 Tax=Acinetobacter indicus TaxID=756892 RepID=V2VL31_9GAMM|nr:MULTISPECIES: hypothetical protein [Acinetobacter]AVH14000.1 hypothetical protein CTZ23_06640 [Acinetobacter indicus]ENW89344.1 hypothetical protein F905_01127 [Acinetobacter sp. CIP 53.82]EPF72953.1 hypothetical protein F956_01255 [Acinetobacter indicus ANC 4215]ESK48294.1 hypothetical protein P253_00937 [Acinetobacter indicus CIP 110367]MBA0155807.1 hypothetical protein [Acinetobacter indicus]